MGNDKLLKKLSAMLEIQRNTDEQHLKDLRKVLHKLKKNQKALKASLDTIGDAQERRKAEQDIEVIKLQRKKGVAVYKNLKKLKLDRADEV